MKYEEIKNDLFSAPIGFAFAHCISKDKALGAGIAKTIRYRFPNMILKMQNDEFVIGKAYGYTSVDVSANINRSIINLVTKDKSYQKPTYDTLEQSLYSLKELVISHNIKNLAMPKIGCGLDKLEWERVSYIIQGIFHDIDINIRVYFLQ